MEHKDVLMEEEKVRLNGYFADVLEAEDSYKLQSFCWYMARHFGLRSVEVFAKLKKKTVTCIEIRAGEDSNEFFVLNTDFLTKNSSSRTNSRHAA